MIKHGTSHGLAILSCTTVSGVLVGVAKDYYPTIHKHIVSLCNEFSSNFGLAVNGEHVATIMLAGTLAFIWGVAFSAIHEDI